MAIDYNQNSYALSARAEVSAATLTDTFAAVSFTDASGTAVTVFDCSKYRSLHVIGKAATQNADVKVQVRNASGDDWVDLAAAATLTAGTAADVYEGIIRARYMQIVAKDTAVAGASVDVSFCLGG
jgi:hypothetical protein